MTRRSKTVTWITAGLLVTTLIGLIPLLAPELMLGARAIPTLMLMVVIAIIVILSILKATSETVEREKRKRSAEEMDRYAMMQQLVDNLGTDERAYSIRLLNQEDAEPTHSLSRLIETESNEVERSEPQRF